MGKYYYSEEEEQYIREHYPNTPNKQIANKLGRTVPGIQNKALRLGVSKPTNNYTREEHQTLTHLYLDEDLTARQVAEKIDKTESSVTNYLSRNRILKNKNLTPQDEAYIAQKYGEGVDVKKLAETLNVTPSCIYQAASRLGVNRPPPNYETHYRCHKCGWVLQELCEQEAGFFCPTCGGRVRLSGRG